MSNMHENEKKKELGLFRICAWCSDSRARTRDLEAQGWSVTHGICDDHYNTLMPGSVFEQENRAPFVEGPVDES